MTEGIDPVWEERYRHTAYRNHYPWDSVVSFIFRNAPRDKNRGETKVIEVGCGNGANLWFAAREGFRTAGIDGSPTAISYAVEWFTREGLAGDFHVGDYTHLPWETSSCDLAIDRAALSYASVPAVIMALRELHRVLRSGGRLMFTPYSDRCSSFDGCPDPDGCYRHVTRGSIRPGAQVRFYSLREVRMVLHDGWQIETLEHKENTEFLEAARVVHAEWLIVARKL